MKSIVHPEAIVHRSVKLEDPVHIEHLCELQRGSSLGRYSYLSPNCTVGKGTSIGRFCSIARNTNIGAPAHPTVWMSTSPVFFRDCYHFKKDAAYQDLTKPAFGLEPGAVIGHDVWVGTNVTVLRGVNIGNGAILAGGAFVNRDVAPYEIVGGVPARRLKRRFDDETVARFQAVRWWDMELSELEGIPFNRTLDALDMLEERAARPADG